MDVFMLREIHLIYCMGGNHLTSHSFTIIEGVGSECDGLLELYFLPVFSSM